MIVGGGLPRKSKPRPKPKTLNPETETPNLIDSIDPTWTPKVCRIVAFYRFWAMILPTLGGLGILKAP